jgi:hypothetical protein
VPASASAAAFVKLAVEPPSFDRERELPWRQQDAGGDEPDNEHTDGDPSPHIESCLADRRGAEERSDERVRREQRARALTDPGDESLLIGKRIAPCVVDDFLKPLHRF